MKNAKLASLIIALLMAALIVVLLRTRWSPSTTAYIPVPESHQIKHGGTTSDDKDLLQGTWVAAYVETDGRALSPDEFKFMRSRFQGNKLFEVFSNHVEKEGTYRIDPTKTPKQLDIIQPTDGLPLVAIYDVSEKELMLCYRWRDRIKDNSRPTVFATKPDSKLQLVIFRRQES